MIGTELRPDVYWWTAWHPEWRQDVGCFALELAGEGTILIDPLLPPGEEERLLASLKPPLHVLLAVFWHARSAAFLVRRADARLWVNHRARAVVGRRAPVTDTFRPGEPLPGGIVAFPTARASEVIYWLATQRTLMTGDVLLARQGRLALCPQRWLPPGTTTADLRDSVPGRPAGHL